MSVSNDLARYLPRRIQIRVGFICAMLSVIAVLFPSIWFIDSAFALVGGRTVKMAAWVVVMGLAATSAAYCAWVKYPARRDMLVAMMLVGFAVVYYTIRQWMSPPVFNLNQAVSLCILVPFSLYAGLSARGSGVALVLTLLGTSVLLLFGFTVIHGGLSLEAETFQALLPAKTSQDETNTGYQGLSLFAGFLPVMILARLAGRRGRMLWLLGLFALSTLPVFYIGGRSALVALAATFFVWVLLNGLKGKRQCLIVILLMAVALALGAIGYHYLERAPLGIQRLIWLVDSDEHDSSKRLLLWGAAVKLWFESPMTMLVGHGPQQFPRLIGYDEAGMYPHNFILELLAEYGVVGTLLFGAPLLYLLAKAVRSGGLGFRSRAPFYFLFYYTTAMMFMGGLQSVWPLFFFVGWLWADMAAKGGRPSPPGKLMTSTSE